VIAWLTCRQRLSDPPLSVQLAIVEGHYENMLSHYGTDIGVRIARKHVGWYSKGLPGSGEFRALVNQASDPVRVRALIRAFYERVLDGRTRALPLAADGVGAGMTDQAA
jgi:tRNA-dihydrouridine synthase B